jgi:hypothetical protein
VVLQATGQTPSADHIITATFELGNSSSVRKRVTAILHDVDFSDLSACTFWLPPGQPLSSYVMRSYATKAWGNATFSMYAATIGTDQWIRLDNVTMRRTPGSAALGTECIEPGGGSADSISTTGFTSFGKPTPPAAPSDPTASGGGVDPMEVASDPIVARTDDASEWLASSGFSLRSDADVTGDGRGWVARNPDSGAETLDWRRQIDLRSAVSGKLTFWSWLSASTSRGEVQITTDGVTWETVSAVPTNDNWQRLDIDLGRYVGQVVGIRFAYEATGPGAPADLWRVDGVAVESRRRR